MKTENEIYNNIVDQLYKINQDRIAEIRASKETFSYTSNDAKSFPLLRIASNAFWGLKEFPLPPGTEIVSSNNNRFIVLENQPVSARDKVTFFPLAASVDVYSVTQQGINPSTKQPIEQIKLARKSVPCGSNFSFYVPSAPSVGSILKTESGTYYKITGYSFKSSVATAEVELFTPAR